MNKILIFVYGTLLSGQGNHIYFLGDSKKVGEHVTEPEFEMLHLGGYPGLVEKGHTAITGEVYEVDELTFRHIDGLEGYHNTEPSSGLYNRKQIATPYGDAWVYIYNDRGRDLGNYRRIPSGSWKNKPVHEEV